LNKVASDVNRYNRLNRQVGIRLDSLNHKNVKPPSKEVQEEWQAEGKAEEAEKNEIKGILFVHLIRLYKNVYGLFDAIEDTQDAAKKTRLEDLAQTAIDWVGQITSALGSPFYDTLGSDNTPVESPDRSRCHTRLWTEQWATIDQAVEVAFCPEEVMADLPCKDYEKYKDEQLAWVVNASYRIIVQLDHWVKEEMTEKVLHYYVYNRDPCQHRIITIAKNMDNLITHWQYYNQELSKNLSKLYDALQNTAKQTDKHYLRLSVLPYWNEKDYNPKQVKQYAAELHDRLFHIASMAYDELEKEENPAETEQKDEGSKIMIMARTSKENWEAIRNEYNISKKDFGKKIKFVKDQFRRKIIFRDIEHAFVLASQDFSKSALILAGGVIEELLRLYLEYKKIKPKGKRFVDYIEACENNRLLKHGVSRLTDSIRDFRNLVHLKNEETKRHTVSTATAKGAVASIFTIANDFQ
jgi:hypothetical protein